MSNNTRASQRPAAPPAADSPAAQSDAALGIGEDDALAPACAVDVEALMSNPAVLQAIDSIVEARLKAAGAVVAAPNSSAADFDAFLSRLDQMIGASNEQKPGYIKPLSSDEIEARNQGKTDMFALLRRYKEENIWPQYLLDDEANPFYGPSPNGPMLYSAGQTINTRLPPSESFRPLNEPAIRVIEAYHRWIGDVVPVEDLIAQAARDARGESGSDAPEVIADMKTLDPEVQLVDAPIRDVAPKRVLGTITPELRGRSMPNSPGAVAQPAGPVFVDA